MPPRYNLPLRDGGGGKGNEGILVLLFAHLCHIIIQCHMPREFCSSTLLTSSQGACASSSSSYDIHAHLKPRGGVGDGLVYFLLRVFGALVG
jgi:hypothetical protein